MVRVCRTARLFPYTTLFRSAARAPAGRPAAAPAGRPAAARVELAARPAAARAAPAAAPAVPPVPPPVWRSEEHTSELQTRGNLVWRLLLEKKKHPACRRVGP